MLRAGELRHRVTLQWDTGITVNEVGETTAAWTDFAGPLPAHVEPLAGRELWNAQQIQPDISHKVTIRYLANVTSKMRVIYGQRTFHIEGPPTNIGEKNRELMLMCREAV